MRILILLSFFVLSACSDFKAAKESSRFFSSENCSNCTQSQIAIEKAIAPEVLSRGRALKSYMACTSLGAPDAVINKKYQKIKDGLPLSRSVDSINNVTVMTATKVAMLVCEELVDKEKVVRSKFFEGFHMKDKIDTNANVMGAAESLTASCWGRVMTPSEEELLSENFGQWAKKLESPDLAFNVCVTILSAVDAQKQ